MGYSLRYISTDPRPITLDLLAQALKGGDPLYKITDIEAKPFCEYGTLKYGSDLYGDVEINCRGAALFAEELEELAEMLEGGAGEGRQTVRQTLENATVMVALQVAFQDRPLEITFAQIEPLWKWLFDHRSGLLQVEAEGYYDRTKLILEA